MKKSTIWSLCFALANQAIACGPGVTNVGSALEERLLAGDLDRRTSEGVLAVAAGGLGGIASQFRLAVTDVAINPDADCIDYVMAADTVRFDVGACPERSGDGTVTRETSAALEITFVANDLRFGDESLSGQASLQLGEDAAGQVFSVAHDVTWLPFEFSQAVRLAGQWRVAVTVAGDGAAPVTRVSIDSSVTIEIGGQNYDILAAELVYGGNEGTCKTIATQGSVTIAKADRTVSVSIENCEAIVVTGLGIKTDAGLGKWLLRFTADLHLASVTFSEILPALVEQLEKN